MPSHSKWVAIPLKDDSQVFYVLMKQSVIEKNRVSTWQERKNQQLLYKSNIQSVFPFMQSFLSYYIFNMNMAIVFCQKVGDKYIYL